jgi:hypothetical protein
MLVVVEARVLNLVEHSATLKSATVKVFLAMPEEPRS